MCVKGGQRRNPFVPHVARPKIDRHVQRLSRVCPGGFERDARIENAGSVRLTSSGLSFLEKNVGTLANILQLLRLPDGTVKVLVEGTHRVCIHRFTETRSCFIAEVSALEILPEGGCLSQDERQLAEYRLGGGFVAWAARR